MRRAPTHRWRGGRVAEGGGLLNRYTVNPVSWVRIPSPPPPKYLILLIYVSLQLSRKLSRLSAALCVHAGAVAGRDGSPSVAAWQTPPLSLLAIVGVPFGNGRGGIRARQIAVRQHLASE